MVDGVASVLKFATEAIDEADGSSGRKGILVSWIIDLKRVAVLILELGHFLSTEAKAMFHVFNGDENSFARTIVEDD